MAQITLNKKVPEFKMTSTAGEDFSIKKHAGKNIVLYFYPKDATPGCTIEGHEFSKLLPTFKKLNTVVYGISRDSLKSHEKFKTKECYTVDLLSDEDQKVCDMFDVIKDKNMYGKKVKGIERSTFFIDEDGVLRKEWRKVKAEGHAQQVLEELKAYSKESKAKK